MSDKLHSCLLDAADRGCDVSQITGIDFSVELDHDRKNSFDDFVKALLLEVQLQVKVQQKFVYDVFVPSNFV